jgi:hypothetical protein
VRPIWLALVAMLAASPVFAELTPMGACFDTPLPATPSPPVTTVTVLGVRLELWRIQCADDARMFVPLLRLSPIDPTPAFCRSEIGWQIPEFPPVFGLNADACREPVQVLYRPARQCCFCGINPSPSFTPNRDQVPPRAGGGHYGRPMHWRMVWVV